VGARHRSIRCDEARANIRPALTFASNALAAGAPIFELARVMGTSIEMIERHYGTLLDGSAAGFAARLDAFDSSRATASSDV
jgi:hypothetical protein